MHAERLLTRERNMPEAVRILTGGAGVSYVPTTSVTPVDGVFPPPCFTTKRFASFSLEDEDKHGEEEGSRWKRGGGLPATLAPAAARASAMVHLAVCVKQARQNSPKQNQRWVGGGGMMRCRGSFRRRVSRVLTPRAAPSNRRDLCRVVQVMHLLRVGCVLGHRRPWREDIRWGNETVWVLAVPQTNRFTFSLRCFRHPAPRGVLRGQRQPHAPEQDGE